MTLGLFFWLAFFIGAGFVTMKLVDYSKLKPKWERVAKITIGLVCLLFVVDVISRILGYPLFGLK